MPSSEACSGMQAAAKAGAELIIGMQPSVAGAAHDHQHTDATAGVSARRLLYSQSPSRSEPAGCPPIISWQPECPCQAAPPTARHQHRHNRSLLLHLSMAALRSTRQRRVSAWHRRGSSRVPVASPASTQTGGTSTGSAGFGKCHPCREGLGRRWPTCSTQPSTPLSCWTLRPQVAASLAHLLGLLAQPASCSAWPLLCMLINSKHPDVCRVSHIQRPHDRAGWICLPLT